jgi:hypothetical protein
MLTPVATSGSVDAFTPWHQRRPVAPGLIRMLTPPPHAGDFLITTWYWKDATLTIWLNDIDEHAEALRTSIVCRALYPADHIDRVRALFAANQRRRMLFKIILARLRARIWSRRPACNTDLITLEPVADADAIELTDTRARCIFRFHRNDVFKTLMANLSHADEMLPMPRQPTNPYTNAPLTLGQTMALCQRLVAQFAARGSCPPPLLAAFWAARFDLQCFRTENTAALSQQAIRDYFRDIHDDNIHVVRDTMLSLLMTTRISPTAIRRWLETPHPTPLHREWLDFCRDYTLYLNLHVQMRPHWYEEYIIHADAAALARRTPFPRLAPLLPLPPPQVLVPSALTMTLLDISGNMSVDQALEFIQSALLRL